MKREQIRWKLGALAGLAVVLVTLIPQFSLWIARGRDWNGTYAIVDTDEQVYSAYLNSIIAGKPRRNNPYLAGPEQQRAARHESYFSIQFFSPYAIAFISRAFGLTASTAFILLTPIFAFASSLALFWLFTEAGGDERAAAIGVLLVLLCGVLISANLLVDGNYFAVFSFARRYIPGLPFPLFFLFCLFVWRAFTRSKYLWWAVAAGVTFCVLIYSYFYLWTTAGAWLFALTLLTLIVRRGERPRILIVAGIIVAMAVAALIPYFYLLSQRATTIDQDQALIPSHAPDVFRLTEILGLLLIGVTLYGVRKGALNLKSPAVLFVIAAAIAPLTVLNQQVITGLSLQPFHYEQFILCYLILTAAVVLDAVWWRQLTRRPLMWIGLALVVGVSLALKTSNVYAEQNNLRDEGILIFAKLEEDAVNSRSTSVVLFDQTLLAASAPTSTSSLTPLWSPYTYTYGTIDPAENNERLFQYFYLLGANEDKVHTMLSTGFVYRAAVFGLARVNPTLTRQAAPVTPAEVREQTEAYQRYATGFSGEHAAKWPISHVVVGQNRSYDFSNLDRWYQRDSGELVGGAIVYRVRPRNAKQ